MATAVQVGQRQSAFIEGFSLRHPVLPDDGFVMEPGRDNVGRMRAGELLARDHHGEIPPPYDGMLLLPLYQAQGENGFFLGREIPKWEQRAAWWARRLRIDRVVGALPGVHHEGAGVHEANVRLVVDPRAAALYPVGLFHWFGFRRVVETFDGAHAAAARQALSPELTRVGSTPARCANGPRAWRRRATGHEVRIPGLDGRDLAQPELLHQTVL